MKSIQMKGLLTIACLSVAGFASANNSEYVASDNSFESEICAAAASANTHTMNAKLEALIPSQRLSQKYELIANKLSCNGVSIAEFALQAGNYEMARKLADYENNNVTIHDLAQKQINTSAKDA